MDRKDFLAAIGMSAASAIVFSCVGCSKVNTGSPSQSAPTNVDFTLDLTSSSYSALNTNGGYVYKNGIIIARTLSGAFIAVSQYCTHQNYTVRYLSSNHEFYCPSHGATYSESGSVLGGPAYGGLAKYNTQLSGTNLRVYS